ncbi:MAG: zinc ribbon domain-containing protein [Betaproteobacteria bacterium]|nr:zinc ribbon domain-containing protein [Betaproteobacteria bacterium]
MPIFEYACRSCGNEFETLVRASAPAPQCPSCQGADLHKNFPALRWQLPRPPAQWEAPTPAPAAPVVTPAGRGPASSTESRCGCLG